MNDIKKRGVVKKVLIKKGSVIINMKRLHTLSILSGLDINNKEGSCALEYQKEFYKEKENYYEQLNALKDLEKLGIVETYYPEPKEKIVVLKDYKEIEKEIRTKASKEGLEIKEYLEKKEEEKKMENEKQFEKYGTYKIEEMIRTPFTDKKGNEKRYCYYRLNFSEFSKALILFIESFKSNPVLIDLDKEVNPELVKAYEPFFTENKLLTLFSNEDKQKYRERFSTYSAFQFITLMLGGFFSIVKDKNKLKQCNTVMKVLSSNKKVLGSFSKCLSIETLNNAINTKKPIICSEECYEHFEKHTQLRTLIRLSDNSRRGKKIKDTLEKVAYVLFGTPY